MTAEPPVYARELRWLLEQSAGCLCALSAAELRWQPPLPAANSPAAIATHLLGATRVYALGFGCGLPVERDRPAEFAPGEGAIGELAAALRGLAVEIETALAALSSADLERSQTPPRALWGTGEPRAISAREALVESVRHAAIHLGELRLTCDLARRRA